MHYALRCFFLFFKFFVRKKLNTKLATKNSNVDFSF